MGAAGSAAAGEYQAVERNNYPKHELDDSTREKVADMGLGRGINCLHFTTKLLDLQIDPSPKKFSRLRQLTMGSGYSSFKTDVQDWYKLRREMHGSLTTPTPFPVHIDVAITAERKTESRILQRHEGHKVHTRTVYLDIGRNPIASTNTEYRQSNQADMASITSNDETDGDSFSSRLDKLIKIKKEDRTIVIPDDSDPDKKKMLIEICRYIIEEENRGATHFISSVELGAKVYHSKKVVVTQTASKFSIRSGLLASNAATMNVAFNNDSIGLSANYDKRISATVDPRVEMKGARTVVRPEEERVIGYDTTPLWTLVSDPEWRKAMREATLMYVNERLSTSRAVIAAGGPFLIRAGKYCLSTTTHSFHVHRKDSGGGMVSQLEGTDGNGEQPEQQQHVELITTGINRSEETGNGNIQNVSIEAVDKCVIGKDGSCTTIKDTMEDCKFFIDVPRYQCNSIFPSSEIDDDHDPMEDPNFGFYIYCKVDGTKLFLCADSEDQSKVSLVTSVPYPNAYARFYVEFASTRRLAPVSRWPKDSLHVLRKTAYTKRRRYLVIDTNSRQLSFTAGGSFRHNKKAMCQFIVENMPVKK